MQERASFPKEPGPEIDVAYRYLVRTIILLRRGSVLRRGCRPTLRGCCPGFRRSRAVLGRTHLLAPLLPSVELGLFIPHLRRAGSDRRDRPRTGSKKPANASNTKRRK